MMMMMMMTADTLEAKTICHVYGQQQRKRDDDLR